jgi:hypothetical protein
VLTTHPLLAPRSRKSRAIPLTPSGPSGLLRRTFTFTFLLCLCLADRQLTRQLIWTILRLRYFQDDRWPPKGKMSIPKHIIIKRSYFAVLKNFELSCVVAALRMWYPPAILCILSLSVGFSRTLLQWGVCLLQRFVGRFFGWFVRSLVS